MAKKKGKIMLFAIQAIGLALGIVFCVCTACVSATLVAAFGGGIISGCPKGERLFSVSVLALSILALLGSAKIAFVLLDVASTII